MLNLVQHLENISNEIPKRVRNDNLELKIKIFINKISEVKWKTQQQNQKY